jgi:D-arabinitol 2-dehydrogenase
MASVSTRTAFRRFAQPVTSSFRLRPVLLLGQRRGLVSHQDATYPQVPYEKGESVGDKRFSQFDLEGKVFVVTGAASCSPHISRASSIRS